MILRSYASYKCFTKRKYSSLVRSQTSPQMNHIFQSFFIIILVVIIFRFFFDICPLSSSLWSVIISLLSIIKTNLPRKDYWRTQNYDMLKIITKNFLKNICCEKILPWPLFAKAETMIRLVFLVILILIIKHYLNQILRSVRKFSIIQISKMRKN